MNVVRDESFPDVIHLEFDAHEAATLREAAIERLDAMVLAGESIYPIDQTLAVAVQDKEFRMSTDTEQTANILELLYEYGRLTGGQVQRLASEQGPESLRLALQKQRCALGSRAIQLYVDTHVAVIGTDDVDTVVVTYLQHAAMLAQPAGLLTEQIDEMLRLEANFSSPD